MTVCDPRAPGLARRRPASLAFAAMLVFCPLAALAQSDGPPAEAAPIPLFEGGPEADLKADQNAVMQAIMEDPAVTDLLVGRVPVDRLRDAKALTLPLPPGGPERLTPPIITDIEIEAEAGPEADGGDFSLFGDGAGQSASVVVRGDDVYGTVRIDGDLYRIQPLGDGASALYRYDVNRLEEHPPGAMEELYRGSPPVLDRLRDAQGAAESMGDELADSGQIIDLIVAYTPKAAREAGNINALIDLAVTETNRSYAKSGVTPRLRVVHRYRTNYADSGSMRRDRDRFRINGDGFMDEVHGLRNQHRADVAVLILGRGDYCGIAAAILANEATAFAVVGQNCATGYYSFGHEVGHLQGARHDPDTDGSNAPFKYGHGFCYDPGNWRTVMSYNNRGRCPNRRDQWSTPHRQIGGVTTGNSGRSDNVRVLNATAPLIANFRSRASAACRSGFVAVGSRLCIDANVRPATRYHNALVLCRDRRARVATYGDLRYLYTRSSLDAAYNPKGRWIGDIIGDDHTLCGNKAVTADGDSDIGNFEGSCNKSNRRNYWCAYDR